MPFCKINPAKSIRGKILLPGDKSIAHRSIIISAIARGKTYIHNFPANQDCLVTLKALKSLGVKINKLGSINSGVLLCVEGRGLYSLKKTNQSIFTAESGTTFRVLLGALAGQPFHTTLSAGKNLAYRPMRRVTEPLRSMGAVIKAQTAKAYSKLIKHPEEEYPPVTIKGGKLQRISYKLPVASAQVKSALLLAALYAKGVSRICEPIKTRDHTERMLKYFGADIRVKDKAIFIRGQREMVSPGTINIPGDISSASFFIVATILLPDSYLVIKSVGINPTRLGIIRVLKRMGADIRIIPHKSAAFDGEPAGDIIIKSSCLRGTEIKRSQVPGLIDELPILMLASCFSQGITTIHGVEELRVKETDRINSMQTNLKKMGVQIDVISYQSGSGRIREKIVIKGKGKLHGARVSSFADHRSAMSMIIAGLLSRGQTTIDSLECINKSFPKFLEVLKSLIR